MATASPAVSPDSLSSSERMMVVSALGIKGASVIRAMKAESNPDIAALRRKEVDEINNLIRKFS